MTGAPPEAKPPGHEPARSGAGRGAPASDGDGGSGGAKPPGHEIDQLRQRLRALGYLDAGVDRFVLGAASAARRPHLIAWLASVRIGVMAAFLLGPAAAIGLTARLPGLVTGPSDAIIVALYLGVFFGIASAAAAFIAILLVSWLARRAGARSPVRGQRFARAAGLIVGLLSLVYLTLWWQTVIAGGWSAPLWTSAALAVAVAISLLLGHAVAVGASAVIVAEHGPSTPQSDAQPLPISSWRSWMASGIVAFGAAALLLTWSQSRGSPVTPPPLTVVSSGLRVRVIAIDGFDPRIFEDLSAGGRVPALTAASGGAVVRLDRDASAGDPARVWTTIATGQLPEVHGVRGLETRRLAGVQGALPFEEQSRLGRAIRGATDLVSLTRPAVASGAERRAKTFWEVAAEAGLRTVVVNWWATWPAPPDSGVVLSDRATLRLENGGDLDAEVSPAALYDTLRQRWPAIRQRAVEMAHAAIESTEDDGIRRLLERSLELDAIQLALLSETAAAGTDLSVVYLPGLDIAQHALLGSPQAPGSSDQTGVAPSALAARLDALKRYYVALDRLLAPALTPASGEVLMIVTEPGRVTADVGSRLIARGTAIRSAEPLDGAQTEVAPTILHLLGVPIARDLVGAPLRAMFESQFADRYPVRLVATYGQPLQRFDRRQGKPLDQEMIDRLRSLGYVR